MDPNQQQSQQQQPPPPTPTLPQSQQSQPPLNIIISLENCILPESKFTCTPSSLDGLDSQYEYELRILGTELVQTSGILLKLPQVAMATGQVLFQRFYYSKSFVRHKMEMTAMACILLASKIEEAPRRIRDVVNVFNHMRQVRAGLTPQPILLDQNYINLKAKIIRAERQLLKELGFCVHVKHPHKFIVTLLQVLDLKGNKQLMQTSWNYMNDSLRTDVFLRWLPETIACACIYLSANLLRIPLPSNPAWYELFDASEADLESICTTILKLYTQKKPDQAKLEGIVDSLRKQWENSQKTIEKKNEPGGSGTLGDIKNGEIENSETIRDDEKTNEPDLQVTTNSPKANKDVFERLKKRSPSYESSSSPKYEVNKDRSTLKTRDNISRYRDSYDNSKSRRSPSRDNNTNSHSKSYSRSKERSKDYDEFKSHKKHKEDKDYYYSSSKDHYSSKESKYYVKEKSRKHSRHSNRDRDAH